MQEDIDSLSDWCNPNGIQMNTDKTKSMLFGSYKRLNRLPMVDIKIEGSSIEMLTKYKYSGIDLDGQLNYGKHINKVVAVAAQKLKQLRRMHSFLNTNAATLVNKNMILPVTEYGDIFLVGPTVGNSELLLVAK